MSRELYSQPLKSFLSHSFNVHFIVRRQTFYRPHLTAEKTEAETGEAARTECLWWSAPGARISVLASLL